MVRSRPPRSSHTGGAIGSSFGALADATGTECEGLRRASVVEDVVAAEARHEYAPMFRTTQGVKMRDRVEHGRRRASWGSGQCSASRTQLTAHGGGGRGGRAR